MGGHRDEAGGNLCSASAFVIMTEIPPRPFIDHHPVLSTTLIVGYCAFAVALLGGLYLAM